LETPTKSNDFFGLYGQIGLQNTRKSKKIVFYMLALKFGARQRGVKIWLSQILGVIFSKRQSDQMAMMIFSGRNTVS